MTVPATSRSAKSFGDRAEALAQFFQRAGEAPRLVAYDDAIGCPLHHALPVLEWTSTVGIVEDDDLIHAARLEPDSAAAVLERRRGGDGQRRFLYFGPRMDAPPADPFEGKLLYDEPGVRAYEFAQRAHAVGHFLRATEGAGAVLNLLSRRAPELRYVRRWTQALYAEPVATGAAPTQLLAAWYAATGAGFLFLPSQPGEPYTSYEVGQER
jgi:hypothetical protein